MMLWTLSVLTGQGRKDSVHGSLTVKADRDLTNLSDLPSSNQAVTHSSSPRVGDSSRYRPTLGYHTLYRLLCPFGLAANLQKRERNRKIRQNQALFSELELARL